MSTTKELEDTLLEEVGLEEVPDTSLDAKEEVVKKHKESSTAKNTEKAKVKTVEKKVKVKPLDPSQTVSVYNGAQGQLVYVSKKTGERFIWDEFGDCQDMELSELKSAKSSGKSFFMNNWFLFDDPSVVEYLAVGAYYKNALSLSDFKSFFEKSPEELAEVIASLSKGQKRTVTYRAKQLIEDGTIDSMKIVSALETALQTELIER